MPAHTNLAYSNDDDFVHPGRSLDAFPDVTYGNTTNHSQRIKGPLRPKKRYVSVGILCLINLINYMDRFTIAGKFLDLQLTA